MVFAIFIGFLVGWSSSFLFGYLVLDLNYRFFIFVIPEKQNND